MSDTADDAMLPDPGPTPPPATPRPPRPSALRAMATGGAAAPSAVKLCLVALLLLAMLVPHWMVAGVIEEREGRQAEVQAEIAASWGPAQTALGPVLVVPYRVGVPRQVGEPVGPPHVRRGAVTVVPTRLRAEARLAPETRRRGLFGAVVYGAEVAMEGAFSVPPLAEPEPGAELLWREAHLVAGATDLRSLGGEGPRLSWDGGPLAEGSGDGSPGALACHGFDLVRWEAGLAGPPPADRAIPFRAAMSLRGTASFRVAALARRTDLDLSGAWATPTFGGASLPVRSEVTEAEFRAAWAHGSGQPVVRGGDPCREARTPGGGVGVALLEAVPTYRMVSRASKYAAMFLALSFLTYALFELVGRARIHLVQYALLGCSVVLFPLLLLAFGEPLGFAPGYAVGSALVAAQASLYTWSVTRSARLAALFAAVLGALFAFLFVVLSLETYALLSGAVALFGALSLVMLATRRVDWTGGTGAAAKAA